jgi:autotransporter-associated beta strand protein
MLTANATVTVPSAVTLGGALDLQSNGLTLTANAATVISGVVSGTGGLVKGGTAAVTLSGANTFDGGVTFTAGPVYAGSNSAFGVGQLTFAGGTVSSDSATARTFANVYNMGGTFAMGDASKNGLLTFNGAGTMSSATTLTLLSAVTLSGVLSGTGPLTKSGTAELTLGGTNTYAGSTVVNGGTLTVTGGNAIPDTGTVTVTSPGVLKLAGNETFGMIDGSGAVNLQTNALTLSGGTNGLLSGIISGGGSIQKSGSGQMTLSGANTFSGGTTVSSGTVFVGNNSAFGTGTLTVSGGTVASSGVAGAGDRTMTNGLSLGGSLTLGDGTNTGVLRFTGNGSVTAPLTLTTPSAVELTGVLSGAGSLTKLGSGPLTLSGTNTFSGGATVSAGPVYVANSSAFGSGVLTFGGGVVSSDSTSARSVVNTLSIGGNITMGDATKNGVLNFTGDGTLTAPTTLTLNSDVIFSGKLSGAGIGSLTKLGSGLLTLSGANDFAGGFTVSSGWILVGNDQSFGSGTVTVTGGKISSDGVTARNVGNVYTLAGSLSLGDATVPRNGTLTLSGAGTLNAATTLTTESAVVISGALAGGLSAGLTKVGAGSLTLGVANTFSGGVTAGAGAIYAGNDGAFGTGTITMGAGVISSDSAAARVFSNSYTFSGATATIGDGTKNGQITLGGAGTLTQNLTLTVLSPVVLSGGLGGAFGLTKLGAGELTLSATNTYSGATAVNDGTLTVSGGGALPDAGAVTVGTTGTFRLVSNETIGSLAGTGTSQLNLQSNRLTMSGNATTTFAGVVSGAGGSLEKTGTGTLTLGGNNTFTGGLFLSAGKVNIANDAALGSGALTITGGAMSSDSTTARLLANVYSIGGLVTLGDVTTSGALTMNGGGTVSSNTTLTVESALTVGGTVNLQGNTLTITANAATVLSGILSGAGGLVKGGTGALTLSGANSFAGGTVLNGGTVSVGHSTAFGTGNVTINTGVTVASDSAVAKTFSNVYSTAGAVTLGNATNNGALTFSGTGNLSSATTITTDSAVVLAGNLGGAYALTKAGSSSLTLGGANSFTGGVTVQGGILRVGSDTALGLGDLFLNTGNVTVSSDSASARVIGNAFNISQNITIGDSSNNGALTFTGAGTIVGNPTVTAPSAVNWTGVIGGTGNLTKAGVGEMTLSGANTLSGSVTVTGGTLTLNGGSAIPDSGTVTVNSPATLKLGANETVGSLGGSGAINLQGFNLTVGGTLTTGVLSGVMSGSGGFFRAGSGVTGLSGANTFSGGVSISSGTVRLGHNSALGTGTLTMTGGTLSSSAAAGAGDRTLTNPYSLSGSVVLGDATTSGALTWSGGGSLASNVTLTTPSAVTFSSSISGAWSLTKAGSGVLTLGGANTYSGGTTVSSGTVLIGNDAGFGTGLVALNGGVTVSSTSTTARAMANAYELGGIVTMGNVSNTGTLTFGGSGMLVSAATVDLKSAVVLGAALGGAYSLTKLGAGALTLGGANTFSGGVTVNAGSVFAGSNSAFGTGTIALNTGTTLASDASTARTFTNGYTIAGSVIIGDASRNGSLTFQGSGSLSGAVVLDNPTDVILSGAIGGGGAGLTKSGAGELTLSGANTFTGGVTVSDGILTVGGGAAVADLALVTVTSPGQFKLASSETIGGLAGSGAVNLQSNTLTVGGAASSTYSGVMSGGGALVVNSTGSLTLSGTNTFSGGATVNGGTAKAGTDSAFGTGVLTVSGATVSSSTSSARTFGNVYALGGAVTLGNGTDNGALSFTGGGSLTAALALTTPSDVILGGVITGAFGVTKSGAGTLTLNGANTFTGGVAVSSGKVLVGDNAAFGTGALSLASGTSVSSSALLGAGDRTMANTFTMGGSVTLGDGVNTGKLTFGGQGSLSAATTITALSEVEFSRTVGGTGPLTKRGASNVILNETGVAQSPFVGSLAIEEGSVVAAAGGVVGSGITVVLGSGTNSGKLVLGRNAVPVSLELSALTTSGTGSSNAVVGGSSLTSTLTLNIASGTNDYTGLIGGAGMNESNLKVVKLGAGTLAFSGNSSFNGGFSLSAGTLVIGADSTASSPSSLASPTTVSAGPLGSSDGVSSGRLEFGDGVTIRTNGVNHALANPMAFVDPAVASGFSVGGSGAGYDLTLNGTLHLGSALRTITVSDASVRATFGGEIYGAGSLAKAGLGTLLLSGPNSFTGGLLIIAGTALAGSNAAFGTGLLTAVNGVTFSSDSTAARTFTNPYALSGTVTVGNATNNGAMTLNGAGDLSAPVSLNVLSGVVLGGVVSGAGSLTKSGAGVLTLSGANSFSGGATLNAGPVYVGHDAAFGAGTLTLAGSSVSSDGGTARIMGNAFQMGGSFTLGNATRNGALTFNGTGVMTSATTITVDSPVILNGALSGAFALTKTGTAALTLSGTNTFSGGALMNAGPVYVGNDAAFGGGTLTFGGAVISSDSLAARTIGNAYNIGGAQTVGDATKSGTLTFTGAGTLTSAATLAVQSGVVLSGPLSGAFGLTKTGTGALTLSGANTFSGTASMNAGPVYVGHNSAFGSGTLTMGGSVISSDSATPRTVANSFSVTGSRTLGDATRSGMLTFTGNGALTGATTLTIASDVVMSGVVSGAFALTKLGTAELTLGGAAPNTYSGATAVNAGTLTLTGGTAIVDAGAVTVGASGTLKLASSETIGSLAGAGGVNLQSNTLTVGAATGVYSGVMSGAGSLVKGGAGILTLSGVNTFAGGATVNGGTLRMGNDAAFGSGTLIMTGGTVSSDSGTARTVSNAYAFGGSSTLGNATNSGAITLSGSGNVTANSTLTVDSALTVSALNLQTYGLTITANAAVILGGVVSGSGVLTKGGASPVTLTGANTFSGGTSVTAGVVRVGNDAAFGTGNVALSSGTAVTSNGTSARALSNSYSMTGAVTLGSSTDTGALTLSGAGTLPSDLTLTADSAVTLSGAVGGAGKLTKAGSGSLVLSGANTFIGGSVLGGTGRVLIGSNAALGAGQVTFNGAPLSSDSTTARSLTNAYTFDPSQTGVSLGDSTNNGALTFSGPGTLTGDMTFTTASDVTLGGAVGGAFALTKAGNGVMTLSGTNTFTGAVTINGGVLVLSGGSAVADTASATVNASGILRLNAAETIGGLGGAGAVDLQGNALTVNAAADGLYSGVMSGVSGSLFKGGGSALTLSGNNTFTGGATVNAGSLRAGGNSALGTGVITVNSGGTLMSDGTAARVFANGYAFSGAVTLGDVMNTGTLTLNGAGSLTSATTLTAASDVVLGGALSGAFALTKQGTGALTLQGTNTFSGGATLNAGAVLVGNDAAFGSGNLTISGSTVSSDGATARTVGNNYSLAATLTLGNATRNGPLTFSGTGALTGDTTLTAASGVTLSGPISGAYGLTKDGAGELVLSGTNTFSGAVVVNTGILTVGGGAAIADAASVTVTAPGSLKFNSSETVGSLSGDGLVNLQVNALTIGGSFNTLYSGVMSGTGSLTHNGTGSLTLSGVNTFSGGVTVSGGTVLAGGNAAFGSGTIAVNGATVASDSTTNRTFTNAYSFGGLVTLGTLGGGALTFSGNGSLTSNATLTTLSDVILSGPLGGGFSLTKAGAAALTLSGTNTFTGGATLNAGPVYVGSNAAFGAVSGLLTLAGSAVSSDGTSARSIGNGFSMGGSVTLGDASKTGALSLTGNGTLSSSVSLTTPSAVSLNGVISGGFSLTKSGTGALTLSGSNTFTGGATLNAGSVYVGNDAAFGGGTLAIVGSTVSSDSTVGRIIGNAYSFGGSVTLGNGTRNGLLTLSGAGLLTSNTTLNTASDVVLSGVVSGAVSLTKTGTATLTLSGANLFGGGAIMSAGSVYVGNDGAFGVGSLTMGGAVISSDSATARTMANPFTVGGAKTLGNSTRNGLLTFTSTGTLTSATTLTVDSNVVMSGVLSGAFALTKAGVGELTIGGASANTYTGATTVNAGILTLSGGSAVVDSATVTVTAPGMLKLAASETIGSLGGDGPINLQTSALTVGGSLTSVHSGVISGTGLAPSFIKSGSGILTLSGANTFSGGSTLNGGSLYVGNNAALGSGPIAMSGGITFASDSTTSRTLANGYSLGAAVTLGDGTNNGLLTLLGAGTLTSNTTLTVNSDAVLSGVIGGGAFSLTKLGTGALTLGGANTFSGGVAVNAGSVYVGHDAAFGTGSVAITDSTVASDSTTARTVANGYSLGGAVTLGHAARTGVLTFTGTGSLSSNTTLTTLSDVALQGVVGGGAFSLTKLGAGSLTLNGANTFSGGATINAGSVYVGNNAAFGNVAGVLRIAGASVASTAATGAGGDRAIANPYELAGLVSLGDATKNGRLSFSGAGSLASDVTVTAASDVSISGAISEAASPTAFTKAGSGEMVFSGTNTFSGATAVNGGTLTLSGGLALVDSSAVTVGIGGTLKLATSETIGTLAGAGAVNLQAFTLTLAGAGSTEYSGTMSGSGNLLKTGGGTLTLSGSSTASGWVSVGTGGVQFGAGSALGASTVFAAPASSGLSTAAGATFTLGSGKVLGGGGALNGSFVLDVGSRLEPGIADPSVAPGPAASPLLATQIQTTGTFAINGEVKLRLGASATVFGGPGGVASGAGNSKADKLTLSGALSIGAGSTITVVANDGTNGDGVPTAQVGRYDLISYTGSRSGNFFTNKTDLTGLFNAPALRPAWFEDPVSKIIGIIIKKQADGDLDATAGVNDTDGTAALSVDFGVSYRGDMVTRTVRIANVASGGIFSERLRAQVVDTGSVGVSSSPVEVEPGASGDLVISLSTAVARKFIGSSVGVQIFTLTDSPGGVVTSQLVETLPLSVSGEVIGRGYAPWGWGATGARQLGTPTVDSDAFSGTLTNLATTTGSKTVTVSSTAGLGVGMAVSGAGIPAGAKVVSVTDGTTFLMSANAILTGTGAVLSYVSTSRLKPDSLAPEVFFEGANRRMTSFGAGSSHSLFADSDGRVWTVGSNADGQHGMSTYGGASAVPVELLADAFVTQVRFDLVEGVSDAEVSSVTGLDGGQLVAGSAVPVGTTLVTVIPMGNGRGTVTLSRAALSTGTVECKVYRRVTRVAAGGSMSLALMSTGKLYAWGSNTNGQLGVGVSPASLSVTARPMEVRTSGAMSGWQVKSLAVGGRGLSKGCRLNAMSGSTITVDNTDGLKVGWRLVGADVVGSPIITSIPSATTVVISAAQSASKFLPGTELHFTSTEGTHALALAANVDASGTVLETGVFAWGRNDFGQLGNGSTVDASAPVQMILPKATATAAVSGGKVTSVTMVSRGTGYAVAPKVVFSGGGGTGASGTATISGGEVTGITLTNQGSGYTSQPQVWIAAGLDVVEVSAGDAHSLVLMSNGAVYACGRNTSGQLGDKTVTARSSPVKVALTDLMRSIGIGGDHSLAVSLSGDLYTWGLNANGQLGQGALSSVRSTPTKVNLGASAKAETASGGRAHSVVSARDGTGWKVFAFGANHRGQLGKATPSPGVSSFLPVVADQGALGGSFLGGVQANGDNSFAVGGLTVLEPMSSLAFIPVGTDRLISVGGLATSLGSKIVSVTSTSGISVGMTLSGPGIFAGSKVLWVLSGTQLLMSSPSTATGSGGVLSFQTSLLSTYPLSANVGAGGSRKTFSVSGLETTGGVPSITVLSTTGLLPGMALSGPGIPTGSKVASITSASVLVMTQNASSSGTGGTLTYQPLYQWYKDGGIINGATTADYIIPATDVAVAGSVAYHFEAQMGVDSYVSNPKVIVVKESAFADPVIVTQPVGQIVLGSSASLSLTAVDGMTGKDNTLTYSWYRSSDGTNWTPTGDTSRSLAAAATGYMYKCLVKGMGGASAGTYSNTAFVRSVSTLVGKHVGIFENDDADYGTVDAPRLPGRITMDVLASGYFTGRLEYEGNSYSLSGDLLAAVKGLVITVSRVAPQSSVTMTAGVDGLLGGVQVRAAHTKNGGSINSTASLGRSASSRAASVRGVFSAAFVADEESVISTVPGLDRAMPIMKVTVGSSGTVTYSGRAVDGIAVTGSGFIVFGADGRLAAPVFGLMYGKYPYAGQMTGLLALAPNDAMKLDGKLEWRKPDLTGWVTKTAKGKYLSGAIASYQTFQEATAFATTGTAGFSANFKADGTFYSTNFVTSLWDTGTQFSFKTTSRVTAANYTGNVKGARGVVTEGLTGLVFGKAAGTISLNYLRNGRVNYGYGLMFPGGKVYGFLMVDDVAGSAAWTAQ